MKATPLDLCEPPIIGYGRGWLISDKPSGMSVNNNPGKDLCASLNRYFQSNRKAANAIAYDTQYGLHAVHRLDRETSGIILLSCRRDVFDHLAQQFAEGTVTKRYLAMVHGSMPPGDDWRLWRWPLTGRAAGRRNPQGQGRRRPCKTRYRIIGSSSHYSLLECRLLTGRTHQIRRHAVLSGHPLLGDRRYGSLRACKYLEKHHRLRRLGLHAAALTIQPPDEETPSTFEAPELPVELRQLIEQDVDQHPKE